MKVLVQVFLLLVCNVMATAQPTRIPQTIRQLRQIKAGLSTPLPPAIRPLLTQLKQQLLDLISETIQAPENQRKQPRQLQTIVHKKLAQMGVHFETTAPEPATSNDPDEYRYGDINEITLQPVAGNSALLIATTNVGLCCGEDTSLYIFQKRGSRWQLVLRQEANGYQDIDGANGRFRYAISPPDHQGRFFVVTARVNPWCTSNWQMLYYQVLRPGAQPASPQILLSNKESIYLGTDYGAPFAYKLTLTGNVFTLRFNTDATKQESQDGYTSHHLTLRYEVQGDEVTLLRAETRLPQ